MDKYIELEVASKILWLVGQQCAGKTMLSTVFGSCGARVLNIGETLRKDVRTEEFLDSENPYAPELVEVRVQEMILGAIHDFKRTGGTLVIDSAPRNEQQLPLLANVQEISTVIFVLEDYEVRRMRARQKYGHDLRLFEKREAFEVRWMQMLVPICVEQGIDHVMFRGGARNYGIS